MKYHDYKIVKFEDLIINPSIVITSICDFLNVEIHENMFSPPVINTSFKNDLENKRFNKNAIKRWEQQLSNIDKIIVDLNCHKGMKYYTKLENPSEKWVDYRPDRQFHINLVSSAE